MPRKGHGQALHGVLVFRAVYLFSVGEDLGAGFQQNIHQLSRCIFNMLMH